jgi:hypothetical protein
MTKGMLQSRLTKKEKASISEVSRPNETRDTEGGFEWSVAQVELNTIESGKNSGWGSLCLTWAACMPI